MAHNNSINIPTPFPLNKGGTGAVLVASNGGIIYSTASTMAILAGTPTAGQFLQSGANSAPSWSTATFPTVGGPAGNILISNGTNYIASTSLWPNTVGSAGTILRSNGTSNAYSTATFADTYAVSTLLYASSTNAVSGLATGISAGLVTNGSGVPAWQTLTAGQILIGTTGAAPTAAAINSGTGILVANGSGSITVNLAAIADHTLLANISGGALAPSSTTLTALIDNALGSVQGDILYRNATVWTVLPPSTAGFALVTGGPAANPSWAAVGAVFTPSALTKADDTNVTLTLTGTPATALLQAVTITAGWSGQLAIARGGTGVSSVTTSPTASAWAGWDANRNLSANSLIEGYRTTATAGATTTLVVGDAFQQYFTGATTQTVVMPVTSTLVLGQQFLITNNSVGVVTVQSSGGNTIQAMATSTSLLLTVISTSLTTAAAWSQLYSSNGALPLNIVPLSLGGTNAALTAANGAIPYSTATAFALLAAGTSGQLFQSGGAGAPNWTTATYPATAGTSGNVLTSNGTNWTSAAPATNGTVTSVATAGLATGGAITTTGTVTVTAATKSDENTGTSTTTASVPANHYNNPAGIKAWATVANNGSAASLVDSFRMTSVSRSGTGVVVCTMSAAMANTTYVVMAFLNQGGQAFFNVSVGSSTQFTINSFNNVGVAIDVAFNFIVVGYSTA